MSQFEDLMNTYKSEMDSMGMNYDADLLEKIAKGLGPSIFNRDSSTVATSDEDELNRIDTNYLQGKLGLPAGPQNRAAINEVAQAMGVSNRNKYRAIFYYLLCEKFGKADVYA